MTTFATFYPVLRLLLGDNDPYGVYQYTDAVLNNALKSVFLLGRGPEGYSLSEDQGQIAETVVHGDPFALITYEAVLMLVGGEDGKLSYRTRALSVTDSGERKRDILQEMRQKIYDIRDGKEQFVSYQSFSNWVNSVMGIEDLTEVKVDAPLAEVDIVSGGPLSRSINL